MKHEMNWDKLGSEFAFIGRLSQLADSIEPSAGSVRVVQGIGDDTTVLKAGGQILLWTTDMMVEPIHFRRDLCDPFRLGWKSLAVNLSDIAAMGGIPSGTLLSCALPPELLQGWGAELVKGFVHCAKRFHVPIWGGDTNRSALVVLDVSVLGTVQNQPVLRSTAQPGDCLYVTGELGNSRAGLERLLRDGYEKAEAEDTDSVQAHLHPIPRLSAGQPAARHGANAMMDISDGLGADLPKLCMASGCGAILYRTAIPVGPPAKRWAKQTGQDEVEFAIAGGEDYELLIAVPPDRADAFRAAVVNESGTPLTKIGVLMSGEAIVIEDENGNRSPLPAGWEHFRISD